jgi:hypothetical protein
MEYKDFEERKAHGRILKRRGRRMYCLFYVLVKWTGKDKVKYELVIIRSIIPEVKGPKRASQ